MRSEQDESVAWRGDIRNPHLTLTASQLALVRAERAKAAGAQESLDSAMQSTSEQMHPRYNASLAGIENSLKDEESLLRKVAVDVYNEAPIDRAVADSAHDLNRYTLTFPVDSYVAGVNEGVEKLRENGFFLIRGRDLWDDPTYRGINSTWHHEATGRRLEVQFHTPESFQAKQDTHPIFEVQRSAQFEDGRPMTPEHRLAAMELQAERYREAGREVAVPPGHERIEPELIDRPLPRVIPAPTDTRSVATRERARTEVAAEADRIRSEPTGGAGPGGPALPGPGAGAGFQRQRPRGPPRLPDFLRRQAPAPRPRTADSGRDRGYGLERDRDRDGLER